MLSKKNDIVPFENAVPLEEFSRKMDSHLFIFGYSTKKRPNTLILGKRLFYLPLVNWLLLTHCWL